mmetsp:Transcript_8199/g.17807  ORF Transcript_8199/g.17807 Transcript_8199/m.17807 type:complete len:81 (-) Transcript_8199:6-248(-)
MWRWHIFLKDVAKIRQKDGMEECNRTVYIYDRPDIKYFVSIIGLSFSLSSEEVRNKFLHKPLLDIMALLISLLKKWIIIL